MDAGYYTDITDGRRRPRRLTVMLVESHQPTREALARGLRAKGHYVVEAGDRGEAIELGVYEWPDVLIAGARLADGDGWELLPLLRERHPGLVGIAVAEHGSAEHVRRSGVAGFCQCFVRPVGVEELVDAVAECVGRRAA